MTILGESSTLVTLGGAIITTLIAVVSYLWKALYDHFKEVKGKLDECEEQHKESTEQLLKFSQELGEVKGKISGIELVTDRVLEAISDKKKSKNGDSK